MRPEVLIYALATVLVLTGIALSLVMDIPLIGIGFFLMGALLFLLPSVRRSRR